MAMSAICTCSTVPVLRVLTRRAIVPSAEEIAALKTRTTDQAFDVAAELSGFLKYKDENQFINVDRALDELAASEAATALAIAPAEYAEIFVAAVGDRPRHFRVMHRHVVERPVRFDVKQKPGRPSRANGLF